MACAPRVKHVAVMGIVIVALPLRWLLRPCRGRQPRSGCSDGDHISKSMRHEMPPEVTTLKNLNIHSQPWNRSRVKVIAILSSTTTTRCSMRPSLARLVEAPNRIHSRFRRST